MITAIKRQLKVWYSDLGVMLLIVLGGGILGKILFQIMAHFDKEMVEYFPLAALLAAIVSAIFCAIMGGVQMQMSFNMEVSFGCTRKHFLGSFYAACLVMDVLCWIAVILINVTENAMNAAMYPTWKAEVDMLPYVLRWGLPVLVVLTAVGCFCGVLVMRFGKTAFWIMWVIWMIGCIGFPQISDAVHEAPDSLYGKIGNAIIRIATNTPVNTWILIGVTVAVLSVAGTWGFIRKQQVTV